MNEIIKNVVVIITDGMLVRMDCTNNRNKEERDFLFRLSNGDDGAAGDSTATPKTTTYGRYIYNNTTTTGRCGSDFCVLATATATPQHEEVAAVTLVVVSSSSSTVRLWRWWERRGNP